MLRYWTAGESHGKTLLATIDGFPAGVQLETDSIDAEIKFIYIPAMGNLGNGELGRNLHAVVRREYNLAVSIRLCEPE